jgi:glycosyltransferase involved in cell wall biosynthesis
MPLISVVIPAYNAAETIADTIGSVLNQTHDQLEIIVINDGSQDATCDVVKNISDPRLKIFSYENGGVAVSRNRGIARATGEFISFLDADDLWTADKLAAQLSALQSYPEAAVAYSWTNLIDESGRFLRRGGHYAKSGNVFAELLLTNFLEHGSNFLVRQQALKEVGGFAETLAAAQDWDMGLRLAARYAFVAVPSVQILYRVLARSMSTNVTRLEAASLQLLDRAFAQAPDSLQYLKPYSLGNCYKYLTVKALESTPSRSHALKALALLSSAVKYDPALLKTTTCWKVLLKILVLVLLPAQFAQKILSRSPWLANSTTLFGCLRLDPAK